MIVHAGRAEGGMGEADFLGTSFLAYVWTEYIAKGMY